MDVRDFSYEVPRELIATELARPRSAARLLVYDRKSQSIHHSSFSRLMSFLRSGDMIVVNQNAVLPARFFVLSSNLRKREALFLGSHRKGVRVLLQGKWKPGDSVEIPELGRFMIVSRKGREAVISASLTSMLSYLKQYGKQPLPPYIRQARKERQLDEEFDEDKREYHSCFERNDKPIEYSVAAPTASFHFDEELIASLERQGIRIARVSLAVSLDTFAPLESHRLEEHAMHSEWVSISEQEWEGILMCKNRGGRVIALGTTVMRLLEALSRERKRQPKTNSFATSLFIRPPFEFRMVDALITNFHWPETTLLALVATFIEAKDRWCPPSIEHRWKRLYEEAIEQRYRLFSFGDGMLIQ